MIFCSGFSDSILNIALTYQPNVDKLESLFKAFIPLKNGIIYTKVPRGLIISIDETLFFNPSEARIKESSLYILDIIAETLKNLPNYCVIEDHTLDNDLSESEFKENWELSMMRSSNIAEYLIECKKISPDKLFALGFGEYMPFKDNVSDDRGIDKRIDFVILEYEAKR